VGHFTPQRGGCKVKLEKILNELVLLLFVSLLNFVWPWLVTILIVTALLHYFKISYITKHPVVMSLQYMLKVLLFPIAEVSYRNYKYFCTDVVLRLQPTGVFLRWGLWDKYVLNVQGTWVLVRVDCKYGVVVLGMVW